MTIFWINLDFFPILIPGNLEMGKFIESKFGNTLLVDNAGYVYNVKMKYSHNSRIHWSCREYPKQKCYAKALTDGIYVVHWKGEHIHPPRNLKLQNYDRKYEIKSKK